ncbi:MAG TPA: glutathione S-transferase family protein [Alphaproteobacteria bacterium]|nr:glutathione S-transferase family protein [Alphaproteobacteria bacterium]
MGIQKKIDKPAKQHLTLYSHPDSGHCYKVKLMMAIAGLAHDYQIIDINIPRPQRPESFRKLAKFGEVPLLTAGQQAYVQSNAILMFLANLTKKFGAENERLLSKVREWLFWEANRLGFSLPNLRYARRFAPQNYPAGAISWIEGRYKTDISRLDEELADGRTFITGERVTIADFSLCGYLFWAEQAEVDVPRKVQQWLQRISKIPGWGHPDILLKE